MLLLKGKFNNKDYNEEPISPAEIAQAFGLPGLPGKEDVLELRVLRHRIKVDRESGAEHFSKTLMPVAVFNGIFEDGSTFTLRYVKNSRPGPNGVITYTPNNIQWRGKVSVFRQTDYEKFVFLALHPRCATSPFVAVQPWFEVYDPSKEADAAAALAAMQMEIMGIVWDSNRTPDDVMRLKAQGLQIKNETPNITAKTPIAMVRQAVYNIAARYPKEFIEGWNSVTTILTSLLIEARDKSILEHKTNAKEGRPGWVWTKGERMGSVACYTHGMEEPFRALQSHAFSNYDTFMGLLTQTLGDNISQVVNYDQGVDIAPSQAATVETKMAASAPKQEAERPTIPVSQMGWSEKTRLAVESNYIGFDTATGDVRWKNEDTGDFDLKPIIKGTAVETWLMATVTFMGTNQAMYHRKIMNQRLGVSSGVE